VALALVLEPAGATPIPFHVTTLASSASDPTLINPWGLASGPAPGFWIGVNGSGLALVFDGNGMRRTDIAVTIQGDGSVTGVTFNPGTGFNGDRFLFASEDGTFSGWRPALGLTGTAERFTVADPANVYKGAAYASVGGSDYAFLANFRTGAIDVFKGETGAPDLTGRFTDPNLPAGYAPFDVAVLGGAVYVTYAVQDVSMRDDDPGAGHGIVDRFDLNGNLLGRLVTNGALNSPWGLALAPAGFGDVGGDLLVGNFGDGRINAYDPLTGAFHETLLDEALNPITIDGLWGLSFGNTGFGGAPATLYFTAGPDEERGGRFGSVTATAVGAAAPEPATLLLVAAALAVLAGAARRTRRAR
jgi:uncharacterized protein (TIGR03118 family)